MKTILLFSSVKEKVNQEIARKVALIPGVSSQLVELAVPAE